MQVCQSFLASVSGIVVQSVPKLIKVHSLCRGVHLILEKWQFQQPQVQLIELDECRTLWGKCEQTACILATEERMGYQDVSKMTIVVAGSLWWHIVSTSLAWP